MASEENYFDRLPAEIITSIIERISDAKCLCICCSVSKSFAEHVLQTSSVSAEIPYPISQSGSNAVWPSGLINFLKKLSLVQSATIRFSLGPSSREQRLVWWKANAFGFMFVSAEGHDEVPSSNVTLRTASLIMEQLISAFELRFRYVEKLVVVLPNLKYISAVDSMKQGNIVVGEEGIANMRKAEKAWEGIFKFRSRFWIAPEVKLPLSGRVMKNVTLILIRESGTCNGLTAANLAEDNEYGELALTMVKNRATFRLHSFPLPYRSFLESTLRRRFTQFHRYH